jgi:hypothetical protein
MSFLFSNSSSGMAPRNSNNGHRHRPTEPQQRGYGVHRSNGAGMTQQQLLRSNKPQAVTQESTEQKVANTMAEGK